MGQIKLRIFTIVIFSILFFPKSLHACGYIEWEWEYRPLMFKAILPNMYPMQPFIHTTEAKYYITNSDPMGDDRKRNIDEWLKATDKHTNFDDIYKIQYATEPIDFIDAYANSNWKRFENNSFINFLTKNDKNKDLLNYMLFAKKVEATENELLSPDYEDWESKHRYKETERIIQKSRLKLIAQKKLEEKISPFLTDRYAFQLVRLNWQIGRYQEAVDAYDKYFRKPNTKSLMNTWACLFKAMALDGLNLKQEANYYYIYAFDGSSEKKLRVSQLFNKILPIHESLTNEEQSIFHVINTIGYPGRALDKMEEIYKLNNKSKYMSFLVMREINKLEDWMLSTTYLESATSPFQYYLINPNQDENTNEKDSFTTINKETDSKYLVRLKQFIEVVKNRTNLQEEKDYYAIALAHLSLLEENADDAKKYLKQISSTTNTSIQTQQRVEKIWIAVQTDDINSDKFKRFYATEMNDLKELVNKNQEQKTDIFQIKDFNYRLFYTLDLSLAFKYKKMNNIVNYALLKNRSDISKSLLNWGDDGWMVSYLNGDVSYYERMRQLDYYASTTDIDDLVKLLQNNNKSEFEKYICQQPFNKIDAYKDLKGTIAFRNKDFKLAYNTFAEIDQEFWNNNYEFKNYLNEDPFIPKSLKSNDKRSFTYKFNKTDFVKKILDLLDRTTGKDKNDVAEAYLLLGHAFYNTSHWGNSWMMTSYGQSISDIANPVSLAHFPQWRQEYLTASISNEFYNKAYALATNNEQKAYAAIMLTSTFATRGLMLDNKQDMASANKFAHIYFNNYQNTTFAKQNECFGFKEFISKK